MSNSESKPNKQKRLTFTMPKDLNATYANVAILSNTPSEMLFDFGLALPHVPQAKIVSRVIMSPLHAKLLQIRLAQQIASYEQQFGEIKLPAAYDIASQFFKFRTQGDDKEDDGE